MNKPISVDEEIHKFNQEELNLYPDGGWYKDFLKEQMKASEQFIKEMRQDCPTFYKLMNEVAKRTIVKDDLDSRLNHYRRIRQDRRMSDLRGSLCDRSWDI